MTKPHWVKESERIIREAKKVARRAKEAEKKSKTYNRKSINDKVRERAKKIKRFW